MGEGGERKDEVTGDRGKNGLTFASLTWKVASPRHARGLKDEMGFPESGPTRLWIDNKATVALAHDPTSFSKIKHVARRHHFLRECVESGALDVGHISTDFNIADLFTKALEPKKFRLFRAAVMNLPIETLRA